MLAKRWTCDFLHSSKSLSQDILEIIWRVCVCVAAGCKQLLEGPVVSLPAVEGKVTVFSFFNYEFNHFFSLIKAAAFTLSSTL